MANQTSEPGEEFSDQVILDDASLDELSLDDDALFADLDNEIRLDGEGEPAAATGAEDTLDDLNLDLDEESLGQMEVQSDPKEAPAAAEGLEENLDNLLGTDTTDDGLDDLLGDATAGDGLDDLLGDAPAGDGLDDLVTEEAGAGEDLESVAVEEAEPEALDINAFSEELNLDEVAPAGDGAEQPSEDLEPGELELEIGDAGAEEAPLDALEVDTEEIARIAAEPLDLSDEPVPSFEIDEEAGVEAVSEDEFRAAPDIEVSDSDLHLDALGGSTVDDGAFEEAPSFADASLTEEAMSEPSDTETEAFTAVEDLDLGENDVLELDSQFLEGAQGEETEPDYADLSSQDVGDEIPFTPPPAATTEIRDIGQRTAPPVHEPPATRAVGISSEILLSIPHQVSVEMGSVSLNGKDILALNYGSVVQLNRTLGEPVDLVLEGRQIAQGEIVLINGKNLGVRIVAVTK